MALLVKGEPGLGKLQFTKSFAQYVFCQEVKSKQSSLACGQCKDCQLFSAGTHPDFLLIGLEEKAKQIKVDQVRKLVDVINKTSSREGMKVIVIEPAEAMNMNAANALLKSLEEPTKDTLIFLVAHAAHRLLPTIRSRCQTLNIDKPSKADAKAWLSTYISDTNKAEQLLSIANYSPLLARRLDENEYLSVYKQVAQFMQQANSSQANPILAAEKLNKCDVLQVLQALQQLLWDLIKLAQGIVLVPEHLLCNCQAISTKPGFSKRAYSMLEEFQQANQELRGVTNPNTQLLLESLLVRFSALLRA